MLENKIVEFSADIPALWRLQCTNLYNSKNLAALAVRECVQNSLDSIQQAIKLNKITRGHIDISWDDEENSLTITDNGMGMDIDTLHTKFLTLGGTTKGDADNTGGFGLAKSVILGCGTGFKLHTQDNMFTSEDIGVNPIHKTDYLQGTSITLYAPQTDKDKTIADTAYRFEDEVADYVFSSIIPKNTRITLNGEEHKYMFKTTKRSYRMPADLGISSSMVPINTNLELNVFKTDSAVHYLYVRLRGLTQFKTYLSWNANCDITLDFQTTIDPRSSDYPFSTNREGLKAQYQGIVEAIRDKVSQSPTSIARDDRYKETIYDNVASDQNISAARTMATVVTNPQVTDTIKGLKTAVNTIRKKGGFAPQGGYTPVTVMDYVSQTANIIEQAAQQSNLNKSDVIQYLQPKTLFEVNNPLSHSWLIYDDTEWKGHKKLSLPATVSIVMVWDSILKLMASTVGYLMEDKQFYPGIVYQKETMGMCLEKVVYSDDVERRQYIMLNPLSIPSGTPTKVALYLMGIASHELAHLLCGSYEAHGESHSYTREMIMNQNLDNVDNIVSLVKSSKLMKVLQRINEVKPTVDKSEYSKVDLDDLIGIAQDYGIPAQEYLDKYPNKGILRMRLTMALKKVG